MSDRRPPGLADSELLRRHVAGDDTAFAELVRRHRDRLWAIALRTLGDQEEAADALQDALLAAFRRAETFRGEAQVTTWLHRIVVNACLDRARRRRVRPVQPLPEDEDRLAALGEPTERDMAEVREQREDILAALRQLTPEQRVAIVLVDIEGLSVDEAAALLDCAPGTVKSRCSRGRAKLVPLLASHRQRPGPRSAEPANTAEIAGPGNPSGATRVGPSSTSSGIDHPQPASEGEASL